MYYANSVDVRVLGDDLIRGVLLNLPLPRVGCYFLTSMHLDALELHNRLRSVEFGGCAVQGGY